METKTILIAFLLTLGAGLATGIGGLISFIQKRDNHKFLSLFLGLSAGVMVYVSFMELYPEAIRYLQIDYGEKVGMEIAVLSFFAGIIISAIIDKLVPTPQNPHEIHNDCNIEMNKKNTALYRTGFFTAIVIAIHNFPEGIATFMSAMSDINIALPIAIAVALHNIPEGIAVAVPIYCTTGSRKKALKYSFLTGLSEPIGAVAAYLILARFLNNTILGIVFGMVSGIMIFISFDELLPSAHEYGEHHYAILGLVIGMGIMAASLIFFV